MLVPYIEQYKHYELDDFYWHLSNITFLIINVINKKSVNDVLLKRR